MIRFQYVFLALILAGGPAVAQTNQEQSQTNRLLINAAWMGDLTQVTQILDKKSGITATWGSGQTALVDAIQGGHLDVVRLLIDKKAADPNLADSQGLAPLHQAALRSQTEMVSYFLSHGADVKKADASYPLLVSAAGGDPEIARLLLQKGADPNKRLSDGTTPLIAASMRADGLGSVPLLLKRSADVNGGNNARETPLMKAAAYKNAALVKLLLDKGAQVNSQDVNGRTALMLAALAGSASTAKLLLDHKADLSLQDDDGNTALIFTAKTGALDVAKLLTEKKAPLETANKEGATAFMVAHANLKQPVEAWLISKGAQQRYPHFVSIDYAKGAPSETKDHDTTRVILPEAVKTFLQKNFPEYRVPEDKDYVLDWWQMKGAPFVAFGNLTGAKSSDIALILFNVKKPSLWQLVVLAPASDSYKSYIVQSGDNAGLIPVQNDVVFLSAYRGQPACLYICNRSVPTGNFAHCWQSGQFNRHELTPQEYGQLPISYKVR